MGKRYCLPRLGRGATPEGLRLAPNPIGQPPPPAAAASFDVAVCTVFYVFFCSSNKSERQKGGGADAACVQTKAKNTNLLFCSRAFFAHCEARSRVFPIFSTGLVGKKKKNASANI